jgi:hypothetical protein
MKAHSKKVQKPIRFTAAEWEDVERAARLVSKTKKRTVPASSLFREAGLASIRRQIARLSALAQVA